jgi:hypothetical protein
MDLDRLLLPPMIDPCVLVFERKQSHPLPAGRIEV